MQASVDFVTILHVFILGSQKTIGASTLTVLVQLKQGRSLLNNRIYAMTFISSMQKYNQVFSSPIDSWKFRKLRKNNPSHSKSPIKLSVKELHNHSLLCRPNTSDHGVLWDTFYHKYHMPPFELKQDAIILDLGSNVGYTMLHFSCLYPHAMIYGVEMDIGNYNLARLNLEPVKDKCKIIHAAAWSENTTLTYQGYDENNFSVFNNISGKEKFSVQAMTMEKILEYFGLTHIDYLKMDIEGAEKEVLKDPSNWIDRIDSMKIEVHPPMQIDECLEILRRFNFKCVVDTVHPSCVTGIR